MENKKVSVIVTCYNLEGKIGRCLDTLLSQTYENLEILVVDDGSKDNSAAVIAGYAQKDSRVTLISQPNGGVSSARNHGLDLATGEYLLFIDGDDYVTDTYAQRFMEAADGADMVIGGLRFVYPGGEERVIRETEFRCGKEEYIQKHYAQDVAKRTVFGPVNKLYRARLIREKGIRFDETLEIREDGIFVLDVLAEAKTLCGIGCEEYYYVQSAPNQSLVSKFHPREKEINKRFFRQLVAVIGEERLTDGDILRIYPMFLNMDISSVRKLYLSKEYTLFKGLRYIRGILTDETFRKARREYFRVAGKQALKYYRPVWLVHTINRLAAKKHKR